MTRDEMIQKLAALCYYQSQAGRKEGGAKVESFEDIGEPQQNAFVALAKSTLENLDRLNLVIIPKEKEKNKEEIDTLFRSQVEAIVRDFFNSINIWKKDLIPQAELVARICQLIQL